jgi:tetratricopeptide (TPR) repeat protein
MRVARSELIFSSLSMLIGCAAFACGASSDTAPTASSTPAASEPAGPPSSAADKPAKRGAPLLEGMGDHQHEITTKNPEAQKYFNQGLILGWGFNHAEAARSFREASRLDPECAMCFWGEAWVLGPNINAKMEASDAPKAWAAVQKASALKSKVSEKEQAYITALEKRYAQNPPKDRAPLDKAFADAMRDVAKQFPDDLDAQTIMGEALMDLHPWDYWNVKTGKAQPWTGEILKTLEGVMAKNERHPGANHLYIHALEASPDNAKKAVAAADRLGELVPGAGHLVHMPAHIYLRVGRYADASAANEAAIKADQAYITQCRSQGLYPLAYHPHNFHFLWASATFEGRSSKAIDAAKKVASKVPPDKLGDHCWGTLQHYHSTPLYAYARFGKWDEILAEPKPDAKLVYPTAVWHYARGIARVGKGELDQAATELEALKTLTAKNKEELTKVTIWDINSSHALMEIAIKVLSGEMAAKKGDHKKAIKELEGALVLEEKLNYDEPPDWYYPVRHSLGAVYLEAKKPKQAERVYRDDLRWWPENGFSLFGLREALTAQGKKKEAAAVDARLQKAWANADVKLSSSRY